MERKVRPLIDLFIENEKKVSQLYKIYSQKFVGLKDFWDDIHREENGHVDLLKKAKHEIKEKKEIFNENYYSRDIIGYVSNFIDQELNKAKKRKLLSTDALETALRLEQSMIERKCFEMFSPKEKILKRTLSKLNRDTEKHVRRLQKALAKEMKRTLSSE